MSGMRPGVKPRVPGSCSRRLSSSQTAFSIAVMRPMPLKQRSTRFTSVSVLSFLVLEYNKMDAIQLTAAANQYG
jgi:hypothetical protein